jgi:D-alanyl-D-alanine carboxypeptidase
MPTTILTTDDLKAFKAELLEDIRSILSEHPSLPAQPTEKKKFLRTYQVLEMLGISAGTLQTLRDNGTIPYYKLQGTLFYDYQEIMKLLEKGRFSGRS